MSCETLASIRFRKQQPNNKEALRVFETLQIMVNIIPLRIMLLTSLTREGAELSNLTFDISVNLPL